MSEILHAAERESRAASKVIHVQSSRAKLWIVTELYAPEETSTGYVLTRIAEALSGDFDVHVLCGQPTYSARGSRAPRAELLNGVQVKRCAGMTFDKNRLLGRLLNSATVAMSMFLNAVMQVGRNDLVLVVTNPPILPLLAVVASKLRAARVVLLVHDVYPDVMIATGMIAANSLWASIGFALNRWLYRHVARIIVLGRDMAELAKSKLPRALWNQVVVIPNWADVDLITPEPRSTNSLLRELGIAEQSVVLYAGNMGRPNDLDVLVEAADRLRANAAIRFVFLGAGVRRTRLESQLRNRSLCNAVLLEPRPRSEQRLFLNACDVAVVSLVRGMRGVGVPSRLYNIFAAGRPAIVIGDDSSEAALLVKEIGAGWVVEPGDVDKLVSAIADALSVPDRLRTMGARARRAAEEEFSFDRIIEQYRSLLWSVAQ